jgi:hypothetical protein
LGVGAPLPPLQVAPMPSNSCADNLKARTQKEIPAGSINQFHGGCAPLIPPSQGCSGARGTSRHARTFCVSGHFSIFPGGLPGHCPSQAGQSSATGALAYSFRLERVQLLCLANDTMASTPAGVALCYSMHPSAPIQQNATIELRACEAEGGGGYLKEEGMHKGHNNPCVVQGRAASTKALRRCFV